MAWNNIKIEQGVKTYNLTEKQYMQMTEEMLAATTTIDNLEMKLGEAANILRALVAANKRMVETTDAAIEGRINFGQVSKQSAEDAANLLAKFNL